MGSALQQHVQARFHHWKVTGSTTGSSLRMNRKLNRYSTQPFFMSKRAIYVLTYDTQTEAQMNQWVQTIRTRAPKAPVLLIYDKTNDPKNESMADLNLHGLYEHFWLVFKYNAVIG